MRCIFRRTVILHIRNTSPWDAGGGPHAAAGFLCDPEALTADAVANTGLADCDPEGAFAEAFSKTEARGIPSFLSHRTGEGYGLTQDADIIHFFASVNEWIIQWVLWLQDDPVGAQLNPL